MYRQRKSSKFRVEFTISLSKGLEETEILFRTNGYNLKNYRTLGEGWSLKSPKHFDIDALPSKLFAN